MRVPWLREETGGTSGESAAAKKLLGVEMPGGMSSSLSVVEVTTQMERPGVLTGSRVQEAREMDRAAVGPAESEEDGDKQGIERGTKGPEETTIQLKSPFEVEGEF